MQAYLKKFLLIVAVICALVAPALASHNEPLPRRSREERRHSKVTRRKEAAAKKKVVSSASEESDEGSSESDSDEDCWHGLEKAKGKHALSCNHYDKVLGNGMTRCIYASVRKEVDRWLNIDRHNAAHFLRMHFHDCFVNGCDGSIMLRSSYGALELTSERQSEPNLTLEGYDLVEAVKIAVSRDCSHGVSCADIMALSASAAVTLVGGPNFTVPLGRLDGCVSEKEAPGAHMPSGQATVTRAQNGAGQPLQDNFAHVGLDIEDLVALSGAHTLGHVHCGNLKDRMDYGGQSTPVPIDSGFKQKLYDCCVKNKFVGCYGNIKSGNILEHPEVDLEQGNTQQAQKYPPKGGDGLFDNSYYKNIKMKMATLTSDQALYYSNSTKALVEKFAKNQDAFFSAFVRSMVKMGNIIPSNMGVTPGAGMPICGTKGTPQCLAYTHNTYAIRPDSCSYARKECEGSGLYYKH